MLSDAMSLLLQATPPDFWPSQFADDWSFVVRLGWGALAFALVTLFGLFVLDPTVSRIVTARNRNNPTVEEAVSRYLRLAVVVVAFLVGALVTGYGAFLQSSALVVAAATLALGVAGQTVIGSLVSGMVLVLDPEFNVGDYIQWEGGEGTVRSITLRVTRVQTPDGGLVTLPNTTLTSQAITRPYGYDRTRIAEHVGIAYEDDVDEALSLLTAAARDVEGVVEGPSPRAYVDEFSGDAVVLRGEFWVSDLDRRGLFHVRSEYARHVKQRLDGAGITLAPASKRELLGRVAVDSGE
ncbi:mechanosensitive ion channel family protein [Haloarchaeobius iranensis]|uniref:Small-conductance mechanosensitive channel n=1 Tax=Haloarchaeobius iranensis TaxID=996166 RepID=A0A1G9XQD0_9EURY|nr:mechanosensitive ion channel domain-containing protein [Haloarchaeobius iranensis]SDM98731.1 Small-conductance mechanosensitive channel [Haloarchaeobius iranensis]